MSVVLSEHLSLLATAPDGIQKLRGLILELAVRGKLVPQDPNDEPASELLKRIAKERARLEAEGVCKKSAPMPLVEDDGQPFAIPSSWVWRRLGDTVEVLDSLRKPVTKGDRKPGPYPYYGASGIVDHVSEYLFDEDLVLVGEDGAKWGAGDQTAFAITGKTWVNNHAHVLRPNRSLVTDSFLIRALVARDLQPFITGITVPKLNQAKLVSIEIPIPPLAEQHRIVAKVDELMALCDRLEAEQTDAEAAHARLVETLLGTLTQSTDAADLATNWQRLAEHFDTLFTTEASLDALKQTILQLAVMGKLVPQDLKDEPASELLKRIAKERERMEAEGVCKKSKPLPPVGEDEQQHSIPESWEYVRLQELCSTITDGTHQTPKYTESGRPFLSAQNVKPFRFMPDFYRYVSEIDYQGYVKTTKPEFSDILLTRVGAMIGEAAVIDRKMDFAIYVSLALLKPMRPFVSSEFVTLWLNSPFGTHSSIRDTLGRGVSAGNLNLGMIRAFALPLPPVNEQHRIIAKVDELMALCDRLRADLAESCSRQARLSATLIESALAAA